MRALDKSALDDYGIPGLILMENAAGGISDYICSNIGELTGQNRAHNILVVCGGGNNGGDGFAAARKLHIRGFNIRILSLAPEDKINGDAKTNLEICNRLGLSPVYVTGESPPDTFYKFLDCSDLVVDAIFGTGFRGRPDGIFEHAINAINASGKKVVSADVPSGLDALTGIAAGACVRADVTLTLGLYKTGLISGPDTGYAGKVELVDIGIPQEAIDKENWDVNTVDRAGVMKMFAARRRDAHKGDFGRVMIITGSPGMTGAGCLAAEAALTAGAGLAYIAAPGALAHIYDTSVREAVTLGTGTSSDAILTPDIANAVIRYAGRMDAVAIGPGMSTHPDAIKAILKIIASIQTPMVIDADALNAVSTDISTLKRLRAPAVLTPHEAEMGRLLGTDAAAVKRDRLTLAREFASDYGVTLVLKGSRTIIATPDGRAYVNTTGNPGMATAGSGDVLTGIITAFMGAGTDASDAAAAAVCLHGFSGDMAAAALGEISLRASDIIRYLHKAFTWK